MRDHEGSEREGDDLVDQIIDKGKLVFSQMGQRRSDFWRGLRADLSLEGQICRRIPAFRQPGPFASLDEALQTRSLLIVGLFDVTSPASPAAELGSLS